jgi:hypothetical protein
LVAEEVYVIKIIGSSSSNVADDIRRAIVHLDAEEVITFFG